MIASRFLASAPAANLLSRVRIWAMSLDSARAKGTTPKLMIIEARRILRVIIVSLAGSLCDAGTPHTDETVLRVQAETVRRVLWVIRNRLFGSYSSLSATSWS